MDALKEEGDVLPDLSVAEYAALCDDIAARGVVVPVVVDAGSGEVVDGRHRLRAFEELRRAGHSLPDYPRDVRRFASVEERLETRIALNVARRQLTRPQRGQLVVELRARGWSLRRIGELVGCDHETVRSDLAEIGEDSPISLPARVARRGGGSYPARRPSLLVRGRRDELRARAALAELGDDAFPANLLRAEERARVAALARRRAAVVPPIVAGDSVELRLGDLREVLCDLEDGSVDAIVTDPPYNEAGVPLYEELGRLAARVLKTGRLAAVYAGHLHLDEEMRLLAAGGLTYAWHGVNVLPGRHTRIRTRMVNGRHRSVLLYSAGEYRPRRWLHDLVTAEGRGGAEERPFHPWQQALEPVRHWVRMTSEPGELVLDPFLGSGTTALACRLEGRRFLGCDIDPACLDVASERLRGLGEELSA